MEPIVKSRYQLYIESPEFADIRSKVFWRDGHKCRACGSTESLQAHHLSYRNVYHEDLDDIICLCRTCHAAYHAVDNIQRLYDELTENKHIRENEERQRKYQEDRDRIANIESEIVEEIEAEYAEKDYAKNGDFNMIEWSVLNPIIQRKSIDKGLDGYFSRRTEIRDWFLCRRLELLLRCIDKGLPFEKVRSQTKFDSSWLYKWYRRDKIEARLKEEKFIKDIKEETK